MTTTTSRISRDGVSPMVARTSITVLPASEVLPAWSSLTTAINGTMLAMPKPWARLAASRQSTTIHELAPLKPKKILYSLTIGDPDWFRPASAAERVCYAEGMQARRHPRF